MGDHKGLNGKDFFIGAVVGGFIGATAALLLAPKTGRETREDLSRNFDTAKGVVLEKSDQFTRRANEVKDTAADKWIEIRDTASSTVKEVASTVEEWKDVAGKKKAQDEADQVEASEKAEATNSNPSEV
ncbi:YtxH domain-containing protein [Desmospora activa]|uniref:Gas vesicle protein n=1 Tax=Desmospora activa DSM 45169 TaxID=1121389 RepID=A0A2T4ZDK0_9BACL|nr:YtxH domain-containing protein [Desmospora activa]PTM59969.1 gas vesicle protein [Desmospora activa DSM 45169]